MVTLRQFSGKFLERLQAPDFGLSSYQKSAIGVLSPAAKEILAKALQPILSAPGFLRQIHDLGERYKKLVEGQQAVGRHEQEVRLIVTELRNALKTLGKVRQQIVALDRRLSSFIEWRVRKPLNEAVRNIEAAESSLAERKATRVSEIHPAVRTTQDEPSRWKPFSFLLPYDYPLPTLRTKAPDQWLTLQLDASLSKALDKQNVSLS